MDSVLNLLETAGSAMLGWVGWMNVTCALLLAGAIIADRLLASRVAPAWRMLLYAAVFARLAMPVGTPSPIGLAPAPGARVFVAISDPSEHAKSAFLTRTETGSDPAAQRRAPRFSALQLVLPAYVLGVAALLAAWWVGARRLRAAAANTADTGRRAGPCGGVPVLRHESLGPVLIGAFSPRIVIPAGLTERGRENSLDWVLRHESAHLARRDPLLAAALHAATIAAWPILAAWLAAARVRALMEQACDQRALCGAGDEQRAEYGRTLIDLASTRRARWCAPDLPFGADVRSRFRAIAVASHWPAAAQVVPAVVIAAALVACSGSRTDRGANPVVHTRLTNASAEPHKGSLPIRITILRTWPAHSKLDFRSDAPPAGAPEPNRGLAPVLTREEFAEILADATGANPDAVLARPRMEVLPGSPATIRVGDDQNAFSLESNVTRVMIPAGQTARVYTMDLAFERTDDGRTASSASVRGVEVPQGRTVALLATARTGAEQLLVCVSPGPEEVKTRFADADEADETRPLINFDVRIHRVDAPHDYGSPKGDGPRRNWSAYPGGRLLEPAEYAAYIEELRGRAGYAMLAAPQVWVYPDQEATIQVQPEDDAPEATQIVRVRGRPDGDSVLCTGSYERIIEGTRSEGSWSRPARLEAGGAMVWSLHDPERGAWYTVTIQAGAHEAGSIRPQRAVGPAR